MTIVNFEPIYDDYTPNALEDEDYIYKIKEIVENLPEAEKRVLLLYSEERSMRKVAKALNVSTATAFHYIHAVQDKVIREIEKKIYDIP